MTIKEAIKNTKNYRLNWVGWILIWFVSAQIIIDFGVLWGLGSIITLFGVFWVGAINQEFDRDMKEKREARKNINEELLHDW